MRIWKNVRCKCRQFFIENQATTNWQYSKPFRLVNSLPNQCCGWVSSSITPIPDLSLWIDQPEQTECAQKHWSENWYEGVCWILSNANLDKRLSSQKWIRQIDTFSVVSDWHLRPKHSLNQHLAKHPWQVGFDGQTQSLTGCQPWCSWSQQSFRVAGKSGSKPSQLIAELLLIHRS